MSLAAAACTATGDGSGEFGSGSVPGSEAPGREDPPRAPDVPAPAPEDSAPAPDAKPPASEVAPHRLDVSTPLSEVSPPADGSERGDGGVLGECAGVEEACGFETVSWGSNHGCALREGGEVVCWGWSGSVFCFVEAGESAVCVEDSGGAVLSPVGEFVAVDAGPGYSCGVRVGGALSCWRGRWEASASAFSSPPVGVFTAVSAGEDTACGVRVGGRMTCWAVFPGSDGSPWPEDVFATEGFFESVSVGDEHVCGLSLGGRVACRVREIIIEDFGRISSPSDRILPPPEGVFTALSSSSWIMCGIREDATVACWGPETFGEASPPEGEFVSVDAGGVFSCGVRIDGEVECWGVRHEVSCESHAWCPGWDYSGGAAPEGPFMVVSVAPSWFASAICGVRVGGELVCWNNGVGFHRPPVGRFVALDGGPRQVCGVRVGGGVACWGLSASDWSPPVGEFVSVSVGTSHACGLRRSGRAVCWGEDSEDRPQLGGMWVRRSTVVDPIWGGELSPPGGEFVSVSVGQDFACGLRRGGEAVCWGANAHWRATPPPGRFVSVSAAGGLACGLRRGGEAVCWGDERDLAGRCSQASATYVGDAAQCRSDGPAGRASPPPGAFASVVAAEWFACGLRGGGAVECWRHDGRALPAALEGSFVEISAQGGYLCGLRADGRVDCRDGGGFWRDPAGWARFAPAGTFSAVAATRHHACGIRSDATLACWSRVWAPGAGVPDGRFGEPRVTAAAPDGDLAPRPPRGRQVARALEWVQQSPPPGPFDALDSGADVTCGRRPDGTVDCWGSPPGADPPEDIFSFWEPSVGIGASCAVRDDGHIGCWGHDGWEPSSSLSVEGAFVEVSAGLRFACALGADGEVVCWGANEHGQTTPPPPWVPGAPYTAVAAGSRHACALGHSGAVVCWGDNRWGQTGAAAGKFTAITAGYWHTCALDGDGEVACWGDGPYKDDFIDPPENVPTDPPPGPYTAITAGHWHTCALRPDGTPTCWLSY